MQLKWLDRPQVQILLRNVGVRAEQSDGNTMLFGLLPAFSQPSVALKAAELLAENLEMVAFDDGDDIQINIAFLKNIVRLFEGSAAAPTAPDGPPGIMVGSGSGNVVLAKSSIYESHTYLKSDAVS